MHNHCISVYSLWMRVTMPEQFCPYIRYRWYGFLLPLHGLHNAADSWLLPWILHKKWSFSDLLSPRILFVQISCLLHSSWQTRSCLQGWYLQVLYNVWVFLPVQIFITSSFRQNPLSGHFISSYRKCRVCIPIYFVKFFFFLLLSLSILQCIIFHIISVLSR